MIYGVEFDKNGIASQATYDDALEYIKLHGTQEVEDFGGSHYGELYYLHQGMRAFKQVRVELPGGAGGVWMVYYDAIANLIIPAGSLVVISRASADSLTYKCRASHAYVHSIFLNRAPYNKVNEAKSWHDSRVNYRPGLTVMPQYPFDKAINQCSSGIHFFVDAGSAINY